MIFRFFAVLGCVVLADAAVFGSPAEAQEFPFGEEFTLDAAPMRGSKRIPHLEIGNKGEVQFDLWCKSAAGQLSVANDTLLFIPGDVQDNKCPADRAAADDALLATLGEMTNWKRQGDVLTLTGPKSLRFMRLTN